MRRWGMRYGRWWAIQWDLNRTFQLGVHLDPCVRDAGEQGSYGPYLDLHLPALVVSIGRAPIFTEEHELHASYSRGGLSAYDH